MSLLPIHLCCWDYDRVSALADGSVRADGVDLTMLAAPPEETFFRMARHKEFEAAEMSLSSYVVTLMQPDPPFIAIPVFPSRMFRHGCIFTSRRAGISRPQDLIGKRVGVPEYQMTAPVWIRGILDEEFGVGVGDVEHVMGGLEEPGRPEKLRLDLPPHIRTRAIGPTETLAALLADGLIDALFTARTPSTFRTRPDDVARLFPDFVSVEQDYYKRTGIFPIMHTVVIRRDIYRANPWVAQSLLKAFVRAKAKTLDDLSHTAALKAMLPWSHAAAEEARALIGDDWWPYGFAANHRALDAFLAYHYRQGLSSRQLDAAELFAPETLENFVI